MTAYASANTVQRLIRLAYMDAGYLQEGEQPNGDQYSDGLMRLNDIVNIWQTQGLKLWTVQDLAIPLVAGKGKYQLGPAGDVVILRPIKVIDAYYLDSSSVRRPLISASWTDFIRLAQPAQQGSINTYFVDKQISATYVGFWLIPDANAAKGSVHLIIQNQAGNSVSLTDSPPLPIEWFIALRWALAEEISTGQPDTIVARCQNKAASYKEILENQDVENSPTFFTPDQRGSGNVYR